MSGPADESPSEAPAEPATDRPWWGLALPTQILVLVVAGQAVVVELLVWSGLVPAVQSGAAVDSSPSSSLLGVPVAATYAALLLLVRAVARRRFRANVRALPGFARVSWPARWTGLATGVGLYLVNLAFSAVVDVGIEKTEIGQSIHGMTDLVLLVIPVCVLAPVFEEVLFRGLFFHPLERRGRALAIGGTAVAFAAIHLLPYANAPLAVLPVFLVGLANGWLRARSGSIEPCIASHAAFNLLGLVSWAAEVGSRS